MLPSVATARGGGGTSRCRFVAIDATFWPRYGARAKLDVPAPVWIMGWWPCLLPCPACRYAGGKVARAGEDGVPGRYPCGETVEARRQSIRRGGLGKNSGDLPRWRLEAARPDPQSVLGASGNLCATGEPAAMSFLDSLTATAGSKLTWRWLAQIYFAFWL